MHTAIGYSALFTLYGYPVSSRIALALMQKGHLVKLSMSTGSDSMSKSSFAFVAAMS